MKLLGIPALTPEWHARRREGLTATDAVKVLGLSPYGTALDVWAEKTGKLEREDISDKPFLEWGNRTEEMHRRWVSDLADVGISRSPGLAQDAELPWLLATPDGLIADRQMRGGFELDKAVAEDDQFLENDVWTGVWEAKAPSPYKKGEWEDGPPLAFQVQVQAQLRVTGLGEAICSQLQWPGVDVHHLERNDAFIEGMVEELTDFWEGNVLQDIPPEPSASDIRTLQRLYAKVDASKIVELPASLGLNVGSWAALQEELAEIRKRERGLAEAVDAHKARILAAMGEAEFATAGEDFIFKRGIVNRKPSPASTYQTFRRVKEIK